MRKIIKRIHINQHNIRDNKKLSFNKTVITIKTNGCNIYAHNVKILGNSEVIYSPDKPLSCGAKVWIETKSEVHAYTENILDNKIIERVIK
tara:strand:+ start:454 stop:726 length:273 start_codon:yes stop_codon:yes gene_type:complete